MGLSVQQPVVVERTYITDGTAGTILVGATLALALSLARYAASADDYVAKVQTDQTPETGVPRRDALGEASIRVKANAAAALLEEWLQESPEYDQRTWGEVAAGLNAHRTSKRKLFG